MIGILPQTGELIVDEDTGDTMLVPQAGYASSPHLLAKIPHREHVLVTNTHVTNKQLPLEFYPNDFACVDVTVVGGVRQRNKAVEAAGADYDVVVLGPGSAGVSWASLGLDGVIAAGDRLEISYNRMGVKA